MEGGFGFQYWVSGYWLSVLSTALASADFEVLDPT